MADFIKIDLIDLAAITVCILVADLADVKKASEWVLRLDFDVATDCLLFFNLAETMAGFFAAVFALATNCLFLLFIGAETAICFFVVDLDFFCSTSLIAATASFLLAAFTVAGVFLSLALVLTAVVGFFLSARGYFECEAEVEIVLVVACLFVGFVCEWPVIETAAQIPKSKEV